MRGDVPALCGKLAGIGRAEFAGFKDRAIQTFNGVRVGITAATYDDAPNVSSSEDLKFTPTIGTIENDTKAL